LQPGREGGEINIYPTQTVPHFSRRKGGGGRALGIKLRRGGKIAHSRTNPNWGYTVSEEKEKRKKGRPRSRQTGFIKGKEV